MSLIRSLILVSMTCIALRVCVAASPETIPAPIAGGAIASTNAKPDPSQDLITQLASDSATVRENAKKGLLALGRVAIEPLERAAESDDAEVRMSASSMLIALRGRGFLGVQLEEEPAETEVANAIANDGSESLSPAPFVRAVSVVNWQLYRQMGATKPFPAERAGIQNGDRILGINGQKIYSMKGLMRIVSMLGPGRVAQLLIEREGKQMRVSAVLTRNTMTQDPRPPVDLESELDDSASRQSNAIIPPAPQQQAITK